MYYVKWILQKWAPRKGWIMGLLALLGVGTVFLGFNPQAHSVYIYPVDIFRSLTGTFGEPRSNHFHSGIDIRIGGRIGTPVKAARDGYVYRINVSPFGFGKALYLRHPDGQYSVYAHLNDFIPVISDYVYRQQISTRQSEVQLFLRPQDIPVKQGQVIAYGGNSGSSQGPHLHFEIRDPQERIVNPMAYFQEELPDNIAPILREVMINPLSPESHVNGWYGPYRKIPIRRGITYIVPGIIGVSGPVGIAYEAIDLLNGARFRCGINYVRLYLDGRQVYRMTLDRFAFSETRYLNQHIDYGLYQKERKRFEKAFVDEGNRFSAYHKVGTQGVIDLKDDNVHQVRLELEDYHGNETHLELQLQRRRPNPISRSNMDLSHRPHIHAEVFRKVLAITADCPSPDMLMNGLTIVNQYGTEVVLQPTHSRGDAVQFLYPLDSLALPVALVDPTDSLRMTFNFQHQVSAINPSTFEGEELSLRFPSGAVYQDLYLEIYSQESPLPYQSRLYHIGDPAISLHRYSTLSMEVPSGIPYEKAFIGLRDEDGEWSYQGNRKLENRWVSARIRNFGTYAVLADTLPPRVYPVSFRSGRSLSSSPNELRLKLEDDLSGIASKTISASLDGTWLPLYFDYKYDLIRIDLKSSLSSGNHELRVSAEDEVGNGIRRTFEVVVQ